MSTLFRSLLIITLITLWGCSSQRATSYYDYPVYEYTVETPPTQQTSYPSQQTNYPQTNYQPQPYFRPQPQIAYDSMQTRTPTKDMPLIVIDPGHGGKDDGAQAKIGNKSIEKNLNLTTALYLRYYLKQFGFKTAMTRSDDTFVPLKKRASWANDIDSKIFVSVHYNTAPNEKAEGIEVYYYKSDENANRTKESQNLGNDVMDSILKMTGAKSRGVKHANFAVIRETTMPAILVEGGFLSNANDVKNIDNDVYLRKLAWGIAAGIKSYLEN